MTNGLFLLLATLHISFFIYCGYKFGLYNYRKWKDDCIKIGVSDIKVIDKLYVMDRTGRRFKCWPEDFKNKDDQQNLATIINAVYNEEIDPPFVIGPIRGILSGIIIGIIMWTIFRHALINWNIPSYYNKELGLYLFTEGQKFVMGISGFVLFQLLTFSLTWWINFSTKTWENIFDTEYKQVSFMIVVLILYFVGIIASCSWMLWVEYIYFEWNNIVTFLFTNI